MSELIEEMALALAYMFGAGVLIGVAVAVFFIGVAIIVMPAYWAFKHLSEKPFEEWEIFNG